jgi:hypothetical protein
MKIRDAYRPTAENLFAQRFPARGRRAHGAG